MENVKCVATIECKYTYTHTGRQVKFTYFLREKKRENDDDDVSN